MKLLRVGEIGREIPAVLGRGPQGEQLLDLTGVVDDISADVFRPDVLERISAAITDGGLPVLPSTLRVGSPLARIGKIVCVGLNYRQHAAEAGQPVPAEPILFFKAPDTVVGAEDPLIVPVGSRKTDYEVELAVIIGKRARHVSIDDDPLQYVAGYAISNDVSEREHQLERGGQWDKGKNAESFNPLGPWIVTADEVADPQALTLASRVNGEIRQNSTTADMIFPVAELISYISRFMPLYPGDIVNTGTPQGVGAGFDPPRFLRAGDHVELTIEGLGAQRQPVVDEGENVA